MDPYGVLGLTASASDEELEARYRQLLRRHHPDMHQGEGPQGMAQAEYATRLLNQAMAQIRGEREVHAAGRAAAGSARAAAEGGSGPERQAGQSTHSPDGPWWAGPQKTGSPCPFCGVHIADYESYEQHLQESHRFRIEAQRRRGIPFSLSRGVADALRILAVLVSAVALLWLSLRVQLNAIVWFLLWLGTVALFLPSLLLRPKNRRR